jgi:hypothetical protein
MAGTLGNSERLLVPSRDRDEGSHDTSHQDRCSHESELVKPINIIEPIKGVEPINGVEA